MTDAYTSALRILQYRFNSEHELRRKLAAKRFEHAEIDAAIERLRNEKWIDDERFAEAYARTRAAKKIGPGRIKRELSAAGVDRGTADRALAANRDDERTGSDLAAILEKRRRILVRRHGEEFVRSAAGRSRLAGYLIQQGYPSDRVRELLQRNGDDGVEGDDRISVQETE
ncbi:MAG TPA: regulatory protein RecX [Thermoanaerobaculia bacterium]|nr:regulatory protein RecX [Thermoanaerobaculia bacterium]